MSTTRSVTAACLIVLFAAAQASAQVNVTRLDSLGVRPGANIRFFARGYGYDAILGKVIAANNDTLSIDLQSNRPLALPWADVRGLQIEQPNRLASALTSGVSGGLVCLVLPSNGRGVAIGVGAATGVLLGALFPYITHWELVPLR